MQMIGNPNVEKLRHFLGVFFPSRLGSFRRDYRSPSGWQLRRPRRSAPESTSPTPDTLRMSLRLAYRILGFAGRNIHDEFRELIGVSWSLHKFPVKLRTIGSMT
jgi:hypothetical protein